MGALYKIFFNYSDGDNKASSSYGDLFTGSYGEIHKEAGEDCYKIFAGLGKHDELKKEKIKCLAGKLAKELVSLKAASCEVEVGHLTDELGKKAVFPIVEGLLLGGYNFEEYKKDKKQPIPEITYTAYGKKVTGDLADFCEKAKNKADGVNLARTLVNIPANRLTPEILAEKVKSLFEGTSAKVSILDEKECKELNMHTFLAVGESSANKPRFVVIRYLNNKGNDNVYGFIGKGLTFDTGGYSLKSNMVGMKTDMAGAAAVIGAMYALVKNNVKTNVIGILPCCENRLTCSSFLPGDVLDSMNGKTIEIISTDAEGRLVLADALTYAVRKEKVTHLTDIATLTGATARALGKHRAGIFANDEEFLKDFRRAAKKSGEKFWQFPMDEIYRKEIKSDIADLKNSSDGMAGAIFAACFLDEFTEETPWLHLDIAGTSRVEKPVYDFQAKGATGFGAETLYHLALRG